MSKKNLNVYVFGAGASVDCGVPLTKDFLLRGFNLHNQYEFHRTISENSLEMVARLIDSLYYSQLESYIKSDDNNDNYMLYPQ